MSPASKKNGNGNGSSSTLDEPRYVQMSALFQTGAHAMSEEDREKVVMALSRPVSQAKPGELGEAEPISFLEEAMAVVFLFVFLGAMYVRARVLSGWTGRRGYWPWCLG